MAFTSYQSTIITLVTIILASTIFIVYASFSKPGSFMDRLSAKIPTIATFIIAIGIIITYQIFTVNFLSIKRDSTYKIVDRAFNDILRGLDENYTNAPNFINSLFYSFQREKIPNYSFKPIKKPDRWTTVLFIATLIFQSWEDFLTDLSSWKELQLQVEYNRDSEIVWLAIFMGWAQSEQLQEIFPIVALQYNQTTIDLAELLFEYAKKYPVTNSEEVIEVTNKMYDDERYLKIKEEVTL